MGYDCVMNTIDEFHANMVIHLFCGFVVGRASGISGRLGNYVHEFFA